LHLSRPDARLTIYREIDDAVKEVHRAAKMGSRVENGDRTGKDFSAFTERRPRHTNAGP